MRPCGTFTVDPKGDIRFHPNGVFKRATALRLSVALTVGYVVAMMGLYALMGQSVAVPRDRCTPAFEARYATN